MIYTTREWKWISKFRKVRVHIEIWLLLAVCAFFFYCDEQFRYYYYYGCCCCCYANIFLLKCFEHCIVVLILAQTRVLFFFQFQANLLPIFKEFTQRFHWKQVTRVPPFFRKHFVFVFELLFGRSAATKFIQEWKWRERSYLLWMNNSWVGEEKAFFSAFKHRRERERTEEKQNFPISIEYFIPICIYTKIWSKLKHRLIKHWKRSKHWVCSNFK